MQMHGMHGDVPMESNCSNSPARSNANGILSAPAPIALLHSVNVDARTPDALFDLPPLERGSDTAGGGGGTGSGWHVVTDEMTITAFLFPTATTDCPSTTSPNPDDSCCDIALKRLQCRTQTLWRCTNMGSRDPSLNESELQATLQFMFSA